MRILLLLVTLFGFLVISSCGGTASEDGIPSPPELPVEASSSDTNKVVKNDQSIEELIEAYDPPDRELWQKPELIIRIIGDLSDKVVADIGAGSGSFSRRLSQHAEKVIALELDQRWIEFMDSVKRVELSPEYQQRFETRLAKDDNSNLEKGEADVIFLVNTYMYIYDRLAYLNHLMEVLPEGGRIVIIDFKKKRIPLRHAPLPNLRIPLYQVENELDRVGFSSFKSDDWSLDYQYIVIAQK